VKRTILPPQLNAQPVSPDPDETVPDYPDLYESASPQRMYEEEEARQELVPSSPTYHPGKARLSKMLPGVGSYKNDACALTPNDLTCQLARANFRRGVNFQPLACGYGPRNRDCWQACERYKHRQGKTTFLFGPPKKAKPI